jgi:cell wall-associated NlpC family hydrolase
MKNIIISNTILLSSLFFLASCSQNRPEVKKQPLSVYNIMGIEEAKKDPSPIFVVQNETDQNSYPFVVQNQRNTNRAYPLQGQEESIEVISYGSYQPNHHQYYQNSQRLKNQIEWNAKSFLGTKYVWGATGPNKFDCSGFTQWIYRDAGIKIPRVSRDQAKVGEYVRYSNLKRGDMVFFDTQKRRSGKVTHVGIYLGDGNFIHASSGAKKVVIYNFDQKPFYKERFLWGRRVISESNHFASNIR